MHFLSQLNKQLSLCLLIILLYSVNIFAQCPAQFAIDGNVWFGISDNSANYDSSQPLGSFDNPLTDWNSGTPSVLEAITDCAGPITISFRECYYNTDAAFGDVNWVQEDLNDNVTINGNGALLENLSAGSRWLLIAEHDNWTVNDLTLTGWNGTDGGAIAVYASTNVTLNSVIFDNNPTTTPLRIDVGDNFVYGYGNTSVVLNDCVFSNNPPVSETVSTGGMEIDHTANSGNWTLDVDINNTVFSCNARQGFGGALTIENDQDMALTVDISGCSFENNHGDANSGDGGAIYVEGENTIFTVDGTLFSCNDSEGSVGNAGGGAIRIFDGPTSTISNCTFYNNSVGGLGGYGGAINFGTVGPTGPLNISNTIFVENASERGGALYLEGGTTSNCTDCLFLNNSVIAPGTTGGAVFLDSGAGFTVSNTTFTGNSPDDVNATYTDNGGSSSLSDPGITACEGCFMLPPPGCDASESELALNCIFFCSTGPDNASATGAADLEIDISNFTAPTCTDPQDYTFAYLIVDAAGNIVCEGTATDSTPDDGTPDATDVAVQDNISCPGLTPGDYTVVGYHYLTADPSVTIPFIGQALTDIQTSGACGVDGTAATFTVLNPIVVDVQTSCPAVPDGTFLADITITGGYPEEASAGTYTLTTNFGTSIYTYNTPITGQSFTAGQTVDVTVTADGNSTNTGCLDCMNALVSEVDPGCVVEADLSLTKTVDNATPDVGGTVTFTITVTNNGPDDATGVAVQDVVPSGYTNITNISGTGSYTAPNIDWTGLSIANGASATLTFEADVLATGDYVNIASVSASDQGDLDSMPGNPADSDGMGGIGFADPDDTQDANDEDDGDDASVVPVFPILSTDKTSVADAAGDGILQQDSGEQIDYTITLTNSGTGDAFNVIFTDAIPAGSTLVAGTGNWSSSDGSSGTFADGDPLTGSVGDVSPAETVTVTFSVTINNGATGTIDNQALFSSDNHTDVNSDDPNDPTTDPTDPTTPTDPADPAIPGDPTVDPIIPPDVADLSLTKTVDNATPDVGGTVTFTITVTNNGPDDATGVAVQDVVPSGYTNITNISGTGSYTAPNIDWTGLSIANGASATLTFEADVLATGDYVNIASVSASDQGDLDSMPGNPADSDGMGGIGFADPDDTQDANDEDDGDDASVVPVFPILSTDKTSVADAAGDGILQQDSGEQIDYTITLTNSGTGDAFNVIFTDAIPAGSTLVAGTGNWSSSDGSSGTFADGDPLTGSVGDVSPAETVTVTFSVTINNGATGTIDNQALFSSDNHTDVNSDDPNDPTTDPTDPTTPTDPADPAIPGDPTVDPIIPPANTPMISIDKNDADDSDDTQEVALGGTASFTITVTNTGTEDLCFVSVSDPLSNLCDMTYTDNGGVLAQGATWTYICNSDVVNSGFLNEAIVSAIGCNSGTQLEESDTSAVTVEGETADIPTLSEWGLIFLALLLMTYGAVMVSVNSTAFQTVSAYKFNLFKQPRFIPFCKKWFLLAAKITITIAIFGFIICFAIYGAVFTPDLIGVTLCGPLFAYLLHLLVLLEKEN